MISSLLDKYIDQFRARRDVPVQDAEALLDAMITSDDDPLLANLFEAWNRKGIAEDEIFGVARVMRDRCTKINARHENFVDVVGTGGSSAKTFNVSTAAAFVVAGAGVAVAKHGNRAATSNSGSADVLSELGIEPATDPATAERCLNEIGICFMFAPNFHRLSPALAKVRRGLGFPTIFNCVGPLCNPANAPHQLIGVWNEEMVPKMAGALARLGTERSWIVHARDGLDEISLSGPTWVAEVGGGSVRRFEIAPDDFSMTPEMLDGVRVSTAIESAAMIRRVLAGESGGTVAEKLVQVNAAAAFYLAGDLDRLSDALPVVAESIASGDAMGKLGALAEASRK